MNCRSLAFPGPNKRDQPGVKLFLLPSPSSRLTSRTARPDPSVPTCPPAPKTARQGGKALSPPSGQPMIGRPSRPARCLSSHLPSDFKNSSTRGGSSFSAQRPAHDWPPEPPGPIPQFPPALRLQKQLDKGGSSLSSQRPAHDWPPGPTGPIPQSPPALRLQKQLDKGGSSLSSQRPAHDWPPGPTGPIPQSPPDLRLQKQLDKGGSSLSSQRPAHDWPPEPTGPIPQFPPASPPREQLDKGGRSFSSQRPSHEWPPEPSDSIPQPSPASPAHPFRSGVALSSTAVGGRVAGRQLCGRSRRVAAGGARQGATSPLLPKRTFFGSLVRGGLGAPGVGCSVAADGQFDSCWVDRLGAAEVQRSPRLFGLEAERPHTRSPQAAPSSRTRSNPHRLSLRPTPV